MKQRLDILLAQRALAPSREAARRLIMAGEVYVNGQRCDKAGQPVRETDALEVKSAGEKYVSRGGHKLEKAMRVFPLDLTQKVCMDIGASTGGFTDCMLQNGAAKVYAVDVGYGQLAWKLREDARVVNLERTNIRYITPDKAPEPLDFVSIDVAFISLTLVLPVAWRLLREGGGAVALIKPQFEAGREKVGKRGVVRDREVHAQVVEKIAAFASQAGFAVRGLDFSPIKGPQGNIEYLLWLQKPAAGAPGGAYAPVAEEIRALVERSHGALDG